MGLFFPPCLCPWENVPLGEFLAPFLYLANMWTMWLQGICKDQAALVTCRSSNLWLLKQHLPWMGPCVFSTWRECCIWEGALWGQATVNEFGWIRLICPFTVGTKSHTHVESFSRVKLVWVCSTLTLYKYKTSASYPQSLQKQCLEFRGPQTWKGKIVSLFSPPSNV